MKSVIRCYATERWTEVFPKSCGLFKVYDMVYAFCFSKPCYLQVGLCVRRHSKSQRPQYSVPYRIVSRSSQAAVIRIRGSDVTVSSDHLKPAYAMSCLDESMAPSQHLNRRK
ncbi:hypothetical protein J6590_097123 [Homalodisca vitripennis]|nr:hypothetical protein J6590_097123 [Homalodisca vitripennis]